MQWAPAGTYFGGGADAAGASFDASPAALQQHMSRRGLAPPAALQQHMSRRGEEEQRVDALRARLANGGEDSALNAYEEGLAARREAAVARLAAVDAELASATGIARHLAEEQRGAEEAFDSAVTALKERYRAAQDSIARSAGSVHGASQQRVEALHSVLAEQELELQWLRDVLGAAQAAAKGGDGANSAVLSAPTRIALPTASCAIPVPPGRLRRLTGPSGDGLHALRQRYIVSIRTEEGESGQAQLRLHGHINGVRQCIAEIAELLQ